MCRREDPDRPIGASRPTRQSWHGEMVKPMQSKEKPDEREAKKPDKPAVPEKRPERQNSDPKPDEKERPRYSSPPCMMGELDEIMDE